MDYTIVDYGNGRYVFILNDFTAGGNTDMEFNFQITDPLSIQSQSGQFPTVTRSAFVIQSSDFYSLDDYNPSIDSYCAFLAIATVFLLFASFFTHHSIWTPAIDFFHLLYLLIFVNILLPPNPAYCLSKAIYTTLSFLPNVFGAALDSPVYTQAVSSTMFTFLGDLKFVRTQGFLFTVALVLVVVLVVMLVLWKRKVGFAKKYCRNFLKETLPKKYLYCLVYLFFLPCFTVGVMKMRDYSTGSAI